MLRNAGLRSPMQLWVGNLVIATSNFVGVIIPVKLIERLGRKLLICISCFGMICASVMLSLLIMFAAEISAFVPFDPGYLSIAVLVLYVVSFAVGLGPIVGLMTVELAPSSHRGAVVSVAFSVNYISNLAIAQYANLVVLEVYYFPFAVFCAFGVLFTCLCVVETKGKNENEIQTALQRKLNMK